MNKTPYHSFNRKQLNFLVEDVYQIGEEDWIAVHENRVILSSKEEGKERMFSCFEKKKFNKIVDWYIKEQKK